jgi:hypothetical protein
MEEDDTTGLEAGAIMMVIDEMIITIMNRYKEEDTAGMMVIDGMIIIEIVTTIPAVTITHEIISITMSIVEEDTPLTVSTEGMMVAAAT